MNNLPLATLLYKSGLIIEKTTKFSPKIWHQFNDSTILLWWPNKRRGMIIVNRKVFRIKTNRKGIVTLPRKAT